MTITIGIKAGVWIFLSVAFFINILLFDGTKSGGFFSSSEREWMAFFLLPIYIIAALVCHIFIS